MHLVPLSTSPNLSLPLCFSFSLYPSTYLSVVCLATCPFGPLLSPSLAPSPSLSLSLYLYLSIYLSIYPKGSNYAKWPGLQPSNSGRLPQFLTLATTKAKQFCETSFKHEKLGAKLTACCQQVFCGLFTPRLQNSDAGSYEVLHLLCKIILIILANLKI